MHKLRCALPRVLLSEHKDAKSRWCFASGSRSTLNRRDYNLGPQFRHGLKSGDQRGTEACLWLRPLHILPAAVSVVPIELSSRRCTAWQKSIRYVARVFCPYGCRTSELAPWIMHSLSPKEGESAALCAATQGGRIFGRVYKPTHEMSRQCQGRSQWAQIQQIRPSLLPRLGSATSTTGGPPPAGVQA